MNIPIGGEKYGILRIRRRLWLRRWLWRRQQHFCFNRCIVYSVDYRTDKPSLINQTV
jgi:hypothetical protein